MEFLIRWQGKLRGKSEAASYLNQAGWGIQIKGQIHQVLLIFDELIISHFHSNLTSSCSTFLIASSKVQMYDGLASFKAAAGSPENLFWFYPI